jgi:hypothetical protein
MFKYTAALYIALFLLALTPPIVFALWVRKRPWELKDKVAAWDPFIKVMAVSGAVIVGLAAFERYLEQRQQELATSMIERAKGRNEAFQQAMTTSSAIATAESLRGMEEAVTAFWRLYWGELARFEGPSVAGAMIQFGRQLQSWQQTGQKPTDMTQLSLRLAHACREEIDAYEKQIEAVRNRYSVF